MKRPRLIFFAVLAVAGLACGQMADRAPMRGVKRGDAPPSRPTLIVGINAVIGTVAEPGWPLIISATPAAGQPAPTLPADLAVRITSENGGTVALTFEALAAPATPPAEPGRTWVAGESATGELAPGRYLVTIVSGASAPAGWNVESGEIRILAPAPERRSRLSLLKIHLALLRGREDDALAEADRAIAANPRDAAAWVAKSDVLMRKDDPDSAVEALDRALDLHRGDKVQPFPILRRRHAAQLRALEKRGVVAPASPP